MFNWIGEDSQESSIFNGEIHGYRSMLSQHNKTNSFFNIWSKEIPQVFPWDRNWWQTSGRHGGTAVDATIPGNPKCHGLACCIHCQWSPVPRKGMTTYGSTFNANPRTKVFGVYSFWRFLRCSQFHGSRYTKIRQPWWLSRLSNKGKHRSPAASSPPGRWQEPRNGTWSNYVATKHLTMSYRVLQKKQPSTGNHRDTLLTPATPNFNVVIWSVEHHRQKWLFFCFF